MLSKITRHLQELRETFLLRTLIPVEKNTSAEITHHDRTTLDFSSSDYLSLAHHPEIKQTLTHAVTVQGSGSGASPMISGYASHTEQLEKNIAKWLKRDRALFFNSGYHANVGLFQSLANRHTVIFADQFTHASIIDGILLSRAKHVRYRHQQLNHLESLLKEYPNAVKIIVSESIFSMQGAFTDVRALSNLAKKYDALLVIDDAHSIGVCGETGGGIVERLHATQDDLPLIVLPMGKAFAGMGACIVGNDAYIEMILQSARSYKYSTALPRYIPQTHLKTLEIIQHGDALRTALNTLISFFNDTCRALHIPLISYDATPIRIIPIGSAEKVLCLQAKMNTAGFFISAMRPPTVPINQSCIRISLTRSHSNETIHSMLHQLKSAMDAMQ